uniref:Uncharacterized protein n=1 Tax=Trichuris muris TaxID=70415 RepID=A0A5S6Q5U4_TRIMR
MYRTLAGIHTVDEYSLLAYFWIYTGHMTEETKKDAVATEAEKGKQEVIGTTTLPTQTEQAEGDKTPAIVRVKRYHMQFSSPTDEIMSPCSRTLRQHGHFVPRPSKNPIPPFPLTSKAKDKGKKEDKKSKSA